MIRKIKSVYSIMPILISLHDLNQLASSQKIPIKCDFCELEFYRIQKDVKHDFKRFGNHRVFCNRVCKDKANARKTTTTCGNCNINIETIPSIINKSKCKKVFCSKSCAASYNNTHKKHGSRRSKLEIYLEKELKLLYPLLDFHFNRKDAINSELDIYIPELKLAFELNGIFHYEPIYGKEKLDKIQSNDTRKFQACLERNIELCIIDSKDLKYNKPEKFKKYLDIILSIINLNLHKLRNVDKIDFN